MEQLPSTILWAWERRDDLRSINPRETGVAFLAMTISLRGKRVLTSPRFQPLLVPDNTKLIAVVRIEADLGDPLAPAREVASAILPLAQRPGIVALQVDFDATASQRQFYRDLLRELRQELPAAMPLSITALASWCIGDDWISGLPVDEAVPMLFRMGVDRDHVRNTLEAGRDFRASLCRSSMGVSADEMPASVPAGRRIYIFHPKPWSKESVDEVVAGLKRR